MIKIPALQPSLRAWLLEGPLSAHVPAYVAMLRRGRYAPHNLAMKEQALAKLQDPETAAKRFRATDSLLKFLKAL